MIKNEKIKLVFQRTQTDGVSVTWTETAIVEVEVPEMYATRHENSYMDWHLIGKAEEGELR